jgi:chaperonin GroEL
VLIEKKWGKPIVCNDGVTIAKEFELKDPEENLGAQMLRRPPSGPATPSATAPPPPRSSPTRSSPTGVRNIAAGASAIDLKRGLDRGSRAAIEALRALSRPVRDPREKQQVATISAHNDPAIGELVAEADREGRRRRAP